MSDGDTGSIPATAPHPAPIFDTGPHPEPLARPTQAWSLTDDDAAADSPDQRAPVALTDPASDAAAERPASTEPATAEVPDDAVATQVTERLRTRLPRHAAAAPRFVPGQYYFLRWWQLVLLLVAVWIPAAGVGLGLFYWWHLLFDKRPAVVVVLAYLLACAVGALMMATVPDRPLISALAIAVMSAVPASAVAAAVLYGHYYCQQVSPCIGGIIPY